MTNNNQYKEFLDLLDAAQQKRDVPGWQTLHEFDNFTNNKAFDARVFKRGNRIVIGIAGSNLSSLDDLRNDVNILSNNGKIPSQYGDTEKLYKQIKSKYPSAQIESTGYSLGATLSNLLSHRTGIKSTVLAPIGSQHIVDKHKDYFSYDGENITTYGRSGDSLFNENLKKGRQSGNIYIIENMPRTYSNELGAQHLLHNYNPYDIYKAKPYNNGHPTGHAAPIENRLFQSQNPT